MYDSITLYMNISEFPWTSHPFILNHVFKNTHNHNKAISDGKYLVRHMPVIGNVHPSKIDFFFKFKIFFKLIGLPKRCP